MYLRSDRRPSRPPTRRTRCDPRPGGAAPGCDLRGACGNALVAHPAGKTLQIMDITSQQAPQPNPGVVEFDHGGATYRLEALEGEDGGLFLVFADRPSGHESYGAGRYLYTAAPAADGSLLVDFNRAYNPPCVFSAYATCPLPPEENRLPIRIEAGERRLAEH